MEASLVFLGKVTQGTVHLLMMEQYRQYVSSLEGDVVEVIVRKRSRRRTNPQNAYFHGVVLPMLARAAGYEPEEMKDALKMRFLVSHQDGPLPTVRGTSSLSTAEFNEFIDHCIRLGAEMFDIVIPDPRGAIEVGMAQ